MNTNIDTYQQGISLERTIIHSSFSFRLFDRRWRFKNINVRRLVLMEQGNILVQLSFHFSYQVSEYSYVSHSMLSLHQLNHGSHFDIGKR